MEPPAAWERGSEFSEEELHFVGAWWGLGPGLQLELVVCCVELLLVLSVWIPAVTFC